jgi:hypothetical protein
MWIAILANQKHIAIAITTFALFQMAMLEACVNICFAKTAVALTVARRHTLEEQARGWQWPRPSRRRSGREIRQIVRIGEGDELKRVLTI